MVKWNLENIYKFEDTEKLITELKSKTGSFKKIRERLNDNLSEEEFLDIIEKIEKIDIISIKLIMYASLLHSENTKDSKKTTHLSKIQEIITQVNNETSFFDLWFKDLSEDISNKYIEYSGKYHYLFERLRDGKKHTLSEKEEIIINLKDLTGASALEKIYTIIQSGFKFEFENKKLTIEEIRKFLRSPDRKKRKEAYEILYDKFKQEQPIMGEIYKDLINNWKNENINLRKFKSPISVRNFSNDISDETIKTLLNVIKKNVPLFQEYFKIKAKLLDIKDMKRYDVYAPYKKEEKEYTYEESKKIVLETFKEFDQEFYEKAKKVFDENHVHSEIIENKKSGAFCFGALVGFTPYTLLNHTNTIEDVYTMAHELGHCIHDLVAQKQPQLIYDPTLPLAETASNFAEMLLTRKLLKKSSEEETKEILVKQIDDFYGSITRQAYFTIFEMDAHEKIKNGITIEELNELYLKNLEEQFGDSLEIPKIFQYEWSSIPHIHVSPFYCYSYAFGKLLVLSLFKMYENEGKDFIEKYMKILSYGGSESPEKILKEIGIDISKEEFWQQGFNLIKEQIEKLK